MSQFLSKETKVLKEKQSNVISSSNKSANVSKPPTPNTLFTKKSQTIRPVVKRPILNENKIAGSKLPTKSTPLGKTLASKVAKSTPHSSHLSSHQNEKMNTPINRNIRQAFGSSAKENSNKKTTGKNVSLNTPLNIRSGSKSKASPSTFQNPILNGIDYSAIMSRKGELGYSGPGYVVEYDCPDEELKNVHISKGLWKITTGAYTPSKNNPLLSLMGAPQFCTRLDVEPSTHKSPCKPLFGFEFNRNFMKNTNGILRNDAKVTRKLNLCEESINETIDIDINITKKTLRWADILEERKSPASFSILSPYNLTPQHSTFTNTNKNVLTESKSIDYLVDNIIIDKPMKKIRRSLSMNDINDIILDNEDEEENSEPRLNETFELETPSKPLTDSCVKKLNDLDDSLSDLKIPFTLNDSNASEAENNKIQKIVKQACLIDDLQTCSDHLKNHINLMGLTEEKQKLHVNTSDFIKISNLICDMHKSLELFKDKLTFE